jgi:hypothetical protein
VNDFARLPTVTPHEPSRHPVDWCDEPIDWWGPFADQSARLRCALARGHTNDHVAIFGSEDHRPPLTVEVRWSQEARA